MELNEVQIREVREVLMKMAEMLKEVYDDVRERVINIWESIKELKHKKKLLHDWHVQKAIVKNHQVLIRKPLLANIRNSI